MKRVTGRINGSQLKALSFGTQIRVSWFSNTTSKLGVVFGDRVGWEDGSVSSIKDIADTIDTTDSCMVFLV